MVPERFAVLRHAARVPFLAHRDATRCRWSSRARHPAWRRQVNLAPLGRGAPPAGGARAPGARRARPAAARASASRTDEALVRRVTMPAATEENLRQVLGFEMDRLTPFRADDVYFDYRVVSRDAAAGQLAIAARGGAPRAGGRAGREAARLGRERAGRMRCATTWSIPRRSTCCPRSSTASASRRASAWSSAALLVAVVVLAHRRAGAAGLAQARDGASRCSRSWRKARQEAESTDASRASSRSRSPTTTSCWRRSTATYPVARPTSRKSRACCPTTPGSSSST